MENQNSPTVTAQILIGRSASEIFNAFIDRAVTTISGLRNPAENGTPLNPSPGNGK